jgi:hypothetical protein
MTGHRSQGMIMICGSRNETVITTSRRSRIVVDLVSAYSKRLDRCEELGQVHIRLRDTPIESDGTAELSVRPVGWSNRPQSVRDRLGEATVSRLVGDFQSGTPKWKLAQQYGISESSVKRLIRQYCSPSTRHDYKHQRSLKRYGSSSSLAWVLLLLLPSMEPA